MIIMTWRSPKGSKPARIGPNRPVTARSGNCYRLLVGRHDLAWLEAHGRQATAAEILAAAKTNTTLSLVCTLLAPGSAGDASSNARLGLALRRYKGRPVRGRRLVNQRVQPGQAWYVEAV